MYFVDRAVAVIKPKQAFADWLNAVPDNDMELSLDSLRADSTVILIPERAGTWFRSADGS